MCRSIKTLRKRQVVASEEEIRAAARQFVRKISGFREPSGRHEEAFNDALEEIAASSKRLLDAVATRQRAR